MCGSRPPKPPEPRQVHVSTVEPSSAKDTGRTSNLGASTLKPRRGARVLTFSPSRLEGGANERPKPGPLRRRPELWQNSKQLFLLLLLLGLLLLLLQLESSLRRSSSCTTTTQPGIGGPTAECRTVRSLHCRPATSDRGAGRALPPLSAPPPQARELCSVVEGRRQLHPHRELLVTLQRRALPTPPARSAAMAAICWLWWLLWLWLLCLLWWWMWYG